MNEIQVALRALAEAYAQLDMARAELKRLKAPESPAEPEVSDATT